jgi:hypothetical protein
VSGCINISINNGDLIETNVKVIYIDPSVQSWNVTVFAVAAGHAVINFSLSDSVDNRYE